MAIHEFTPNVLEQTRTSRPVPGPEFNPYIERIPVGVAQSSDVQGGRKIMGEPLGTQPEYVQEFLMPGFRALDEAMKTYWSGIRIPTKDSYRFMRIKIAGGDKSILIWRDQLKDGRVKFPVASISRISHEFNPQKFSSPVLAMARRYTSHRMDRVALIRRPVPFLVKYTLTVWASYKGEADYALEQILPRFNPLAEFVMCDQHLRGSVQLRYEGSADASEKEAGFDQKAKTRYEFSMTAEAWLPLPELIVPTILGHVTSIREATTNDILAVSRGNTTSSFYEPT
ncbi:MAG: hypothetical protein M0R50_06890 [Candidatus Cloacimonetes bacterium]|jgi:hypothetical protein|nr:hypothetical protein [Candidatus Cloacimonadota bacterium]